MKNIIKNIIKNLADNQHGAVLPLVGLSLMLLILVAGFAIDYTRAQIVRERLQWAVDAGALAGAKYASTGTLAEIRNEARDYFRANFPEGYMNTRGGSVQAQRIGTVSGKGDGLRFTVSNMTMENYFIDFLGINDIQITATADVNTLPLNPMDMVFAVDMSGSMDWRDDTGSECLYSSGALAPGTGDPNGDTNRNQNSVNFCRCGVWSGSNCPASGASRLALAKTHIKDLRDTLDAPDSRFAVVPWDQRVHLPGGHVSGTASANCDFWSCDEPISVRLALTTNQNIFNNYIGNNLSGLLAHGNTDHANGMWWAYQTIKDSTRLNKSIVFITDGWPTMNYQEPGNVFGTDIVAQKRVFDLFIAHCNRAKNAGINVFTIVYNLEADSDPRIGQALSYMRSCATEPAYAFRAANAPSLARAFNTIGQTMMTMRLTK